MTRNGTEATSPAAQPAPPPRPAAHDPSGVFAGVAALGAAFAGFVSYGRNPDLLATAFMVGCTFFGALVVLFVLHVVYRLAVALTRIAIPAALVLLVGCVLHWQWAETAVHWLRAVGHRGVAAAEQGLSALQR